MKRYPFQIQKYAYQLQYLSQSCFLTKISALGYKINTSGLILWESVALHSYWFNFSKIIKHQNCSYWISIKILSFRMDEQQKNGQEAKPDGARSGPTEHKPKEQTASPLVNGTIEGAAAGTQPAEGQIKDELDLTVARLKDMHTSLRTEMRLQREPVEELRKVLETVDAVTKNQAQLFEGKPDAEAYFFKAFLSGLTKALATLTKITLTKEEFRLMLGTVPPLLARLLFNNLENADAHESLNCIFDHKSRLYQYHYLSSENAILTQGQAAKENLSDEDRSWRESLREGSQLEAIKIDPGLKCKCWATCIVQSVSQNKVRIKFIGESKTCDRDVDLWGPEIAPCGERSKADDDFRNSLAVGDRVDCFDGTGLWYAATILAREVKEFQGEQLQQVLIAFRVLHPEGDSTDKAGNKYFGWEECFDEWMTERSSRIAPYQKHTTESLENQTTAAQNANPSAAKASEDVKSGQVDDSMDHLADQVEGQRIFAVQRKQCRSDLLIDFLNIFGRLGGFDNLVKRIEDFGQPEDDADELVLLGRMIENLAKCSCVLHQSVVNEYFEKIESAALKKILGATNRQLRNTNKETTDAIVEHLYKDILPRLASRDAVGLSCDRTTAVLDIGLLFLSQDFLGRRVDGVKLIAEVAFTCLRAFQQPPSGTVVSASQTANYERKLLMVDQAVEKLMKDGLAIRELFSKERTHTQLVQRTEQLLRLLMAKEQLTAEWRQLIWQASQINDGDMKIDLYKVLTGAAADMLLEDRLFFLDRVMSIPRHEIVDREVELVTEICTALRGRKDMEDITLKGLEFMWATAMDSGDEVAVQVVNRAQMGLSDILKDRSIEIKVEYADRLADRAKDVKQGFLVVKIFARLLKIAFEGSTGHPEIENLSDMIDYLEKKHQLYNIVFQNLVDYMGCVAEELASGRADLQSDPQTKVIHGRYAHSDQITQRLEFIKFYAQSSNSVSVSSEQLDILWEQLALKSPIDQDRKQIYQWLREVCDHFLNEKQQKALDQSKKEQGLVTLLDLTTFYKEKMLRSDEEDVYKDLSLEGFHCIQSFFVLLNGISGKLIRITESYGQYKGKHLIEQKPEQKSSAKAATTGTAAAASTVPATATAIEYDAKTGKMTSFSSSGGAGYASYSWNQGATTSTSTGTGTAPVYGPQKPGEAASTSKDKNEIDPEDLTIEVLVPPNELEGYVMIWRLATESKGKQVIDAAAKLLVQMHHSVHTSLEDRVAEFDDMYIAQCFDIANRQKSAIGARTEDEKAAVQAAIAALPAAATTIMQLGARPVQERRIIRSLFLLKQLIRASEKGGTHDLRPHESLSSKGTQLGALQVQNNVTHGEQYRQRIEISIGDQATLWDLKKRIGVELASTTLDGGKTYALHPGPDGRPTPPVHPAAIKLFQMSATSDVKDPKNGVTLKELKFKANEQLGAFRKNAYISRIVPLVVDNEETGQPELSEAAERALEEVFEQYSVVDEKTGGERWMTKELCVEFTSKVTEQKSSLDDPRVADLMQQYCVDKNAEEKLVGLEGLKRFCINACLTGKEDSLRGNFRRLGYAQDLRKLPRDGEPDNILQPRKSKEEMPRYKIALNEQYFDSLIDLLEYDAEVASRARETIATLATQPVLHSIVSKLEFAPRLRRNDSTSEPGEPDTPSRFDWSSIFDTDNVYKMLYSLEIVAAILVGYTDEEKSPTDLVPDMVDWVKRFLELRGLQELQRQLSAALAKMESESKENEKKLVAQLLQLLRMFVLTATEPEENVEEAQKAEEQSEQEPKQAPVGSDPSQIDSSSKEEVPAAGGYQTPKKKKITLQTGEMQFEEITQSTLFGDDGADTRKEEEQRNGDQGDAKKPEEKAKTDDSLRYMRQVMKVDGLGSKVLQLIDVREIQKQMTKLVQLLLDSEDDLQREDRQLIDSALGLWAQLVGGESGKPDQPEIDKQFVLRGLIEGKTYGVRESFCQNFKELANGSPQAAEQVFEVLFDQLRRLEDLGELKNKKGPRMREYFALLAALIPTVGGKKPDLLLDLLKLAIESSLLHDSTERSGDVYVDGTRVGLFKVMAVILPLVKKESEHRRRALEIMDQAKLLEHIHRDCLFYYGGNQEIDQNTNDDGEQIENAEVKSKRCYTNESRKAAYSVLNEYQRCLEPKEMAEYLQNYILPLVKDVERPKRWRHLPSAKGRVQGQCGLVNLGCICYMISMLQQFFLVPQFRYQLLKAEDNTPENLVEYKGDLIDDNLLRQLRRLFGYLELSARQAYDPKPLCFAFKEFDGSPTKIGEQKDSQEFLNIFFDRLETQLKPTSQRHLLKDVFAGNQCTQLICSSCGKVKNRIELFYNLSLQVKGSAGIYDSLGQLAKGQTIEDFNCDFCNQRTNVVRRQLLADTPNTLIVHLQRIVFSFDTLQNDKINARFEFPLLLNLKDYSFKERMTQEQLDVKDFNEEDNAALSKLMEIDDDEYIYRLVGVNVHVGTADHGHYYSLIDLRRGGAELDPTIKDEQGNTKFTEWTDVGKDPWKVFDDSVVRHFNFDKDLKAEAFGESAGEKDGEAGERKSDAMTDAELASFLAGGTQTYGKSAYMLVYERKSKKGLHEVVGEEGSEETKLIDFRSVPKYVPEWIEKEVAEDNKHFHIDAQMFHDDFFGHVNAFFKWISSELVMSTKHPYEYYKYISQMKAVALQVGGKVLFDMQCYYDRNTQISDFASNFETLLLFCDSSFTLESGEKSLIAQFVKDYLLADDCQHFFKIMFTCTSIVSRKYAGAIAGKAVSRLIRLYNDCKPELRDTVEGIKEVKETYTKVIDLAMVALMDKECQRNAIKLASFFEMLNTIATSSISAAQHFLERSDAIADLIDFMLGNASPRVANSTEKRAGMGGTVPPPFQPLFSMVSFLIRMTHTAQMDLDVRLPTHVDIKLEGNFEAHKSYFLQEEASHMITATDWLDKVLHDPKYSEDQNQEFCKAVGHLCYKDLAFSKKLISKLLKSIGLATDEALKARLQIAEEVALVQDEFQVQRLEYLFGFGFLMHAKDSQGNIVYGRQLQEARTSLAEVHLVVSGLDARSSTDGLIHVLWNYHKRFEGCALTCLLQFLTLATTDETVARYLAQLPAYDYSMARFTDFIRPYLLERSAENEKYPSTTGYKDKQDQLIKVTSVLDQYELFLKKQLENAGITEEQDYIRSVVQPYIVLETGGQDSEKVVQDDDIDEKVQLRVTQVGAFWITSKPKGRGCGNLSLPEPETPQKEEKDQKNKRDEIQEATVKAQMDAMKQSLAMDTDTTEQSAAQAPGAEPQDAKMVVDQVADTNPVVAAAPTVQEKYPDCKFSDDLLYRVTCENKLETPVKVEIQFSLIDDKVPVNLSYPTGGLVDYLKPTQTGTLLTLAKIDPFGGPANMANLRIVVTHSVHSDTSFQMNSFASQSDIPLSTAGAAAQKTASGVPAGLKDQRRNAVLIDQKPDQKTGDVGVGDVNVHDAGVADAGTGPDLPDAFAGQKACGACTFLNAEANTVCEVCGTPF